MSISFDEYGYFHGDIPVEAVRDCTAAGAVDIAVAYWADKLDMVPAVTGARLLVEDYLRAFGAWDDLGTASDETLAERVLWIACGDIAEHGTWHGLVH